MKALLRVFAGLGLMALVVWFVGPDRLRHSFATADPGWILGGFLCSVAATAFSALRWHSLAGWLGMAARRRDLLIAYWRGVTANTLLPGANLGGDTLRALHLHHAGHSLATAIASVLLDRLSGLWILATLSLAVTAVGQYGGALPQNLLPWPAGPTLLFALLALAGPLLLWKLSELGRHILPGKIERLLQDLHALPRPFSRYLGQMGWSGAVQFFSIGGFACGARAVGIDLPLWEFFIAAGPIFILAGLPVSIGGWGTREAASALVLGLLGIPREQAVAAAIIYGLYAALNGLAGSLTFLHGKKSATSNSGEHHA